MKRVCSAILAALVLLALSSPAWAGAKHYKRHFKIDKERIHQMIIHQEFGKLKKFFSKADPEAQQLFLTYLGTAVPSNQDQIEALRADYEQQIADLNSTISTLQQQLQDKTDQLSAANASTADCNTSLTQCQTTTQEQSSQLNADQATIADLTTQLQTCTDSLAQAAGGSSPSSQGSQQPQMVNSFTTGAVTPYALSVDHSGNVVVLDRNQLTIAEFDPTGTLTKSFNPGTLSAPTDIAVDSQGNIYVLDQYAANPLQKFGPDGTPMAFNASSSTIILPIGLYISSNDTIYVTDNGGAYGGRVLKFDSSGNLLGTFGEVADLGWTSYNDIAIDENSQTIYVVIAGPPDMVAKFDMSGNYLGSWQGDINSPRGIAVAANGDIFIADTYNNRIDQYDGNGNLKFSFAGDLYRPYRIVTDTAGKLYAADHQNAKIVIYQ